MVKLHMYKYAKQMVTKICKNMSRPAILISPSNHLFSAMVLDSGCVVAFVTHHRKRHMHPPHIHS